MSRPMPASSLEKIKAKRQSLTDEKKREMLRAGGSVKTKYPIDAQEIVREVRMEWGL